MSGSLLRRHRHVPAPPPDGAELVRRVEGLRSALDVGGDRLDPAAVQAATTVLGRAQERLRLGSERTVVALAGATGSGKSSLFNALAGLELSQVGARRPTTAKPSACVWGTGSAEELLDWLEVPQRHRTERESALDGDDERDLHGLVLLDLPDHDSTQAAHRLEVDRLVALVDLLVWVVDPQKYADEALHAHYLRRLAGHDEVVLVVLNQVDRLSPQDAAASADDLRRLLAEDGLPGAAVLATSARTGEGVPALRARLADVVAGRAAALARTRADLESVRADLSAGTSAAPVAVPDAAGVPDGLLGVQHLVRALGGAAGVPAVVSAVEADHRRRALARTGWVPLRWTRRLRREPLRRLGLAPRSTHAHGDGGDGAQEVLAVSSVPAPSPAQWAQVDLAGRRVAQGAAEGLPRRWADAVRQAAAPDGDDVVDALDRAVVGVDLPRSSPRWWAVAGAAQALLAAAALVGALWLAGIGVLAWLQLPPLPVPRVGPRTTGGEPLLPLPTALLAGGLLVGALLAAVSSRLAGVGARRARRTAQARLDAAVRGVADGAVLRPVAQVLADHARVREVLSPPGSAPGPSSSPAPRGAAPGGAGGGRRGH